jgi:hypothetical protein
MASNLVAARADLRRTTQSIVITPFSKIIVDLRARDEMTLVSSFDCERYDLNATTVLDIISN